MRLFAAAGEAPENTVVWPVPVERRLFFPYFPHPSPCVRNRFERIPYMLFSPGTIPPFQAMGAVYRFCIA